MKDYKRLTERKENGAVKYDDRNGYYHICYGSDSDPVHAMARKLCDFEDKIENGTLVELPCKTGDTVYAPHWHFGEWDKIVPYQITNITITQNKKLEWTKKYRAMELVGGKTTDWQLNFAFDEVGKKVFLTKVEAEAKLAELKGEQQ